MRHALVTCAAVLLVLAAEPATAPAQQTAAPKPYNALAIAPAKPIADPSLDAFRKELGDIAKRKDRAALARLVVFKGFFWEADDKAADPGKSGIDNLTAALGLDAKDGWEALVALAAEPNAAAHADRRRGVCSPPSPDFDDGAFDELVKATQTDASEWRYAASAGIEVRDKPEAGAPVIEKLGLHVVRMLGDDAKGAATNGWIRVATPSGKVGFMPENAILPLEFDQICYVKSSSGWSIAGIVGGADR